MLETASPPGRIDETHLAGRDDFIVAARHILRNSDMHLSGVPCSSAFALLFALGFACLGSEMNINGGTARGAEPPAARLRHVVFFKFKEGTTPEKLKEITDAFGELPKKIDVIRDFEWGTDVSVENLSKGFTHCFFVTFDDEKGRDVYLPHPAHKAFVDIVKPHLDDVCVVDYREQRPKPAPAADKPSAALEALKKPMALAFERNSLEATMRLIAEEIGTPIEIIGTDLQLEGITKNQSFGLDEKRQPAEQLLATILKKANADGKLAYVVKPKQPGGPEMIFITTRRGAATRREKAYPPGPVPVNPFGS